MKFINFYGNVVGFVKGRGKGPSTVRHLLTKKTVGISGEAVGRYRGKRTINAFANQEKKIKP